MNGESGRAVIVTLVYRVCPLNTSISANGMTTPEGQPFVRTDLQSDGVSKRRESVDGAYEENQDLPNLPAFIFKLLYCCMYCV